jgi:hypothetical protein
MTLDTGLRIGAIGLPLFAALAIWRLGSRFPRPQRWLAAPVLAVAGLMALTLFLLNRYYACMFAVARENCLFDAAATVSLFLLNAVSARSCLVLRGEDRGPDAIPLLLLSGAWAGSGLTQNLLVMLVSLNLLLFALDRWLRGRGLGWRFLVLRDDYGDDVR